MGSLVGLGGQCSGWSTGYPRHIIMHPPSGNYAAGNQSERKRDETTTKQTGETRKEQHIVKIARIPPRQEQLQQLSCS